MLLQSSPRMPSSRMSPGVHTQLDTLFTSRLLSAISLAVSVWCLEDPTFLVVWLESWGFTFHDYVSFCGQATGGWWIKETGILLFLLGLQFLCQRTGLGDQDWSESKPRRFPSRSAIHTNPLPAPRTSNRGLL